MRKHLEMYHDMGIPLVFLQPKSKVPAQKEWSKKGFDPKQLDNYRTGMNVGIKLGWKLKNGFFLGAIDVDIIDSQYANEAWTLLSSTAPTFKSWPKVTSGRGNDSGHYYFLSSHPIASRILGAGHAFNKKTWEISIMGMGRQCVAPPSIHPGGSTYTWETDLAFVSVEQLNSTVPMDSLTLLPAPDAIKTMIRRGNTKDRSATIFQCTLALLRSKVAEDVIIEIMTNRSYLLAHVPYEHAGTMDVDKATTWFTKYVLEPAKLRLDAGDLERDRTGRIKDSYANAKILVCEKLFNGEPFVSFDLFRNAFVWDTKPAWLGGVSTERSSGREDALLLSDHLMSEHGVRFNPNLLDELLTTEAMKNQFHPVRDYLDSLTWDGVPRLATLFQTYHNSTMLASYLDEVATLWMVGAVKRIYEPGCKFDYSWVLEGSQGVGKSTFLEILAGKKWFLDSLPNFQDKDASINIQGVWVCEIAELAAMNRSSIEVVKAYLARNVDRVRPPYGVRRVDVPRSTMFAGTTNPIHYLQDPTGARRFWPVTVGRCNFELLRADRDQLWAEAAFLYHYNCPRLYPSFTTETYLKCLHRERWIDDEGDEARALLSSWIASHDVPPAMTLAELFSQGPLISMKRTRSTDIRTTATLVELGFKVRVINGLRYWMYEGHV